MNRADVRAAFLTAGERRDFGLRMAKQELDQLQGRIARGPENTDADHDSRSRVSIRFGVRTPKGAECSSIYQAGNKARNSARIRLVAPQTRSPATAKCGTSNARP